MSPATGCRAAAHPESMLPAAASSSRLIAMASKLTPSSRTHGGDQNAGVPRHDSPRAASAGDDQAAITDHENRVFVDRETPIDQAGLRGSDESRDGAPLRRVHVDRH